jgi:hypothetical protein
MPEIQTVVHFLNSVFSPETIFLNSILQWKNKFKRGLHHTRNSLFRLATDTTNKLTLKISYSLRERRHFFPSVSMPTLKAVLTFRHNLFDVNSTSRRLLHDPAWLVLYYILIMLVLSEVSGSHQISSYSW